MDPNPGPVKPDPKPIHDIAEAGPIDPKTGQPDHHAEVSALKVWLRQNAVSLVISAAVVALVCVYLDPVDTLKVVIGLGFIIFIHELGHFLAAKWCDVHVKTFSIGFGPAVPFCSYKWGETTYMLGIIPLGGYVSMVGEGTGEDAPGYEPDDEDNDPRSFKNKSVGQRMLIISAGVIMNVLFGMACFVAAYLHGVKEEPGTIGAVWSGSAAWRADLRSGDRIVKIDNRENPTFKDLPPIVMSTRKGEKVPIEVEREVRGPDGSVKHVRIKTEVEPLRDEGTYFPQLGIMATSRLTLMTAPKRKNFRPVQPGSPAADARADGGEAGFLPGDRVVAMTDPADPTRVTPIPPADPQDPASGPDFDEYYRRSVLLADKPVTFHVLRKDQSAGATPTAITVQPAYRSDLGMRMRMGKVAAVRRNGPADRKVEAVPADGPPTAPGDRIVSVTVTEPGGGKTRYAAGDPKNPPGPGVTVKPLDPILLPLQLERWAAGNPPDLTVELVVLREDPDKHTEEPQTLTLTYDPGYRFDREVLVIRNSPLAVPGLGLSYWVDAVVSEVDPGGPAAAAGVRPNDVVEAVRVKGVDDAGKVLPGDWDEVKPHQWASAESVFQGRAPHEVDLRVKRGDQTEEVLGLKGRPDTNWPVPDRGLLFQQDYRTHKAADVGEAVALGAHRTVRFIKTVYMNLYAMIFGRVSARTMSGPLTIATVSYKIAGEDFWQFLLFLGMISVNLAVVNFLPIPVLDGGHMVFLIYEKVTGRPVPERLFAALMWTGLVLILLLFLFVITLDIQRLFF